MRKTLAAFYLLLLHFAVNAQVSLSVQLPPGGMVNRDQLWNVAVMNNGTGPVDATLALDLRDAKTGQTVLSAGSGSFLAGKGVKMINIRDLQPVLYNHLSGDFTGAYLPLGSYIACYRLFQQTTKGPVPLADECVRINISPLSPPLLNTPSDKSKLETTNPQFAWLPPAPLDMFRNLTYDLVVAEVLDGQSPSEAVQYNTPVYARPDIRMPMDVYPSSYGKLDTGRIYAWQVIARNGTNYAAATEVWTFSIKGPEKENKFVKKAPYVKMMAGNASDIGIAPDGVLKLMYTNRTNDSLVSIRIDIPGEQAKTIEVKLQQGDNYLEYPLKKVFNYKENIVYRASLVNAIGETWSLQFKVVSFKDEQN
jgi:hypothetical protein